MPRSTSSSRNTTLPLDTDFGTFSAFSVTGELAKSKDDERLDQYFKKTSSGGRATLTRGDTTVGSTSDLVFVVGGTNLTYGNKYKLYVSPNSILGVHTLNTSAFRFSATSSDGTTAVGILDDGICPVGSPR